ncbi:MAG: acyl-CoA desaturase [Bacteroidia bacterium]|nr:acyl-CoA desaturase [Bacteroidia bacterium]
MIATPIHFIDPNKDKAKFFSTLRQRVDAYFKENKISKHCNSAMIVKTVALMGMYLLPFVAVLIFTMPSWLNLVLWSIMGFGLAGVGMSIMHDACHGAYSSSHKVNQILGYSLNMIGGTVFNWKLQHNLLHHTYTNIATHDQDIKDKVILRFSPHTEVKWYHRLQVSYAILFYGLTTIYWLLLKDFTQFADFKKKGLVKQHKRETRMLLAKMIACKVVYCFVFVAMPILFFNVSAGRVFSGFLLMHFIAGVTLTVIFQLAHTVEGTTHPLPVNGTIENNWAIHQMNTTVNFSRDNKIISWYVGGLNYQVEHHLFPTICHVHYPQISHIVKATAEEFGIPYLENKTFGRAIGSHINTMIRFGKLPDLNEVLA